MIYLFAGDDTKNKHSSYEKFLKSMPSGMETFFVDRNDFNETQIESFYSGSSLFSALNTVVFKNVLEHEEVRDFILEKLELMGKSANSFIFLEGKLNKSILDNFKRARAEINVFELPKEKKERFNNFLLANAFEVRDKLNLWIYFRQAVDLGVSLEELTGVLFWKTKDMILKRNFHKFKEAELKNFIMRLSYLLPEARSSNRDAGGAFEHFLLEAF